jgi:NADH:ubiquinone oxidoreductase subunit 6 (subunit J)
VSSFGEMLWFVVSTFVFIGCVIVMFHVVLDLFRDPDMGGFAKAVWIVALIFVPVLSMLVYMIVRGKGMAERQRNALQKAKADTETYIRDVAGKSPADQIADAKKLLDSGTITADEFGRLKAKALA